ncbi:hypothetical protein CTRI78_v002998 [Colletotrichum trifolii]|uniref:Uncharacterized protein n=1 Tax=Colletotrichum trifolii TaxID=5466 RepID=A0A4R8RWM8_COLTR|nr:hypothetical protein CTRI78_v002998 [Colletotrichum trifolii]
MSTSPGIPLVGNIAPKQKRETERRDNLIELKTIRRNKPQIENPAAELFCLALAVAGTHFIFRLHW